MIYISLDTCVWLGLIKNDLRSNNNSIFQEICYWIENKHAIHISPENIIREWERNKNKELLTIGAEIKKLHDSILKPFGSAYFDTGYDPDSVERAVVERMDRVDNILKIHSEIAKENSIIYDKATKRCLECLAPNHDKDSFRDTINILTLINYVTSNKYINCIFSTINYKDFSINKSDKHKLHPQLENDFRNANLKYVYCDEKPFAGKLIGKFLRPDLPSFQDHLRAKQRKEESEILIDKKSVDLSTIHNLAIDYLDNIKYIDLILSRKKRTVFEEEILQSLIEKHDSYKQYFLKNVGKNGLV